ncbi:MAG: hypothetical protein E6I90_13840 [Chloroflexi bacterium]|nr:MAG: hypothetical protein E6I90_13840 [Chloroflexota bacterium]
MNPPKIRRSTLPILRSGSILILANSKSLYMLDKSALSSIDDDLRPGKGFLKPWLMLWPIGMRLVILWFGVTSSQTMDRTTY